MATCGWRLVTVIGNQVFENTEQSPMLQCQPGPGKSNLHLSLNILNIKPLKMMQKRFFFLSPCHVMRSTLPEKTHSSQPWGGTASGDVAGRNQPLGDTSASPRSPPAVWALSCCHSSQAQTWARFYPHRLPSSSIYISISELGLTFLKDIKATGKVLILSPKGIISTTR